MMNLPLKFVNQKIQEHAMQVTFDPRDGRDMVAHNFLPIPLREFGDAIGRLRGCFQDRRIRVGSLISALEQGKTTEISGYCPDGQESSLSAVQGSMGS